MNAQARAKLEQLVQVLWVSTALLLRDQASQKLWREVGTIRPADRAKIRIQEGLFEFFGITKLSEDYTCQPLRQVHLSISPIAKLEGKRIPGDDLC